MQEIDNTSSTETKENINEIRIKDEQIVRYSRTSGDYIYATAKGTELSINVRKSINYFDSQITPFDNEEFPITKITVRELAAKIKVSYKNLKKEIVSGNFLEELRIAAFTDIVKNAKGEITFADFINAMYRVQYDDETEELTVERPIQMQKFLLNLGKGRPYYEISKDSVNNLPKHKQIELYRLIEDELSSLQCSLGMTNKHMMMKDHRWHELHISIYKMRKCTFTLNTYPENHIFVSTFLKRQLSSVSEQSDIEIDKNITTNKPGNNAEYVIISARRKEIENVDMEEDGTIYFEDEKLNKTFKEYLKVMNIDTDKSIYYKNRLMVRVNDTLPSQEGFDTEIALRIVEYSIRGSYKDFFPLKKEEIELIKINRMNNKERGNHSNLRLLEEEALGF